MIPQRRAADSAAGSCSAADREWIMRGIERARYSRTPQLRSRRAIAKQINRDAEEEGITIWDLGSPPRQSGAFLPTFPISFPEGQHSPVLTPRYIRPGPYA